MRGGGGPQERHIANSILPIGIAMRVVVVCVSRLPPSTPLAPPIGPGILPTALFRQECLLAPQRETERKRGRQAKIYSVVWSVAPLLLCDFPLSLVLQRKRTFNTDTRREPSSDTLHSHLSPKYSFTCQLRSHFCHPTTLALHTLVTSLPMCFAYDDSYMVNEVM
jgi:hypothetical protein